MVEHVTDYAILALDPEGRVLSWNEGAGRLKGYQAAEIIGRHFSLFYTPEDNEAGKPQMLLARAREDGRTRDEGWRVRKDGSRFWAGGVITAIRDEQGRLCAFSKMTHDLTERRRSEEALLREESLFTSLCDTIPDQIYFKDRESRFIRSNACQARRFGLTDPREAVGRTDFDFFSAEHARQAYEDEQRIMATGEPLIDLLEKETWPDGRVTWVSTTKMPMRDASGRINGLLGISRDVTAHRLAEEKLSRLNVELARHAAELLEANKELESFSYSASHDLRAPLRHVQGYADMLFRESGDRLSEKGRHYLKVISDSSRELGLLIDALLSFSRMGRSHMFESGVDLDELVNETVGGLASVAPDRRIVWNLAPLPRVRGDRAMLKLVFANLIGNALKYTRPRDTARIDVGTAGTEDGRVILFVRDNGVGFDMKYADKLFGVFQRLHRAEEFEGTGIGLANVRRIILRHGGRAWAEGELDRGATIFFTLKPSAPGGPAPETEGGVHP